MQHSQKATDEEKLPFKFKRSLLKQSTKNPAEDRCFHYLSVFTNQLDRHGRF